MFQHRHMISFHSLPYHNIRTRGWWLIYNKLCILPKGSISHSLFLFVLLLEISRCVSVFFLLRHHLYNVAVSMYRFCSAFSIQSNHSGWYCEILCSFAVSHWKIWYECSIIARLWCQIRNLIFTIDEWLQNHKYIVHCPSKQTTMMMDVRILSRTKSFDSSWNEYRYKTVCWRCHLKWFYHGKRARSTT